MPPSLASRHKPKYWALEYLNDEWMAVHQRCERDHRKRNINPIVAPAALTC